MGAHAVVVLGDVDVDFHVVVVGLAVRRGMLAMLLASALKTL